MVIHSSGMFDYVFTVPEGPRSSLRRMAGLPRNPGDPVTYLVGDAPTLETAEESRQPWQLYSRVILSANDRLNATAASVTFAVARELIASLHAGDVMNVSRTGCGGIGLSIVRDEQLVAAVGAITHVPLGTGVRACLPWDLLQKAEATFRTRDPEYTMPECPIEISASGGTRVLHAGRPTIGDYEVFVVHGFIVGTPGTDECVSIAHRRMCPHTAGHTSAQLLEADGLRITPWER